MSQFTEDHISRLKEAGGVGPWVAFKKADATFIMEIAKFHENRMERAVGDEIYDADGKFVCRLAKTPHVGELLTVDFFEAWDIPAPEPLDDIHPAIARYAKTDNLKFAPLERYDNGMTLGVVSRDVG